MIHCGANSREEALYCSVGGDGSDLRLLLLTYGRGSTESRTTCLGRVRGSSATRRSQGQESGKRDLGWGASSRTRTDYAFHAHNLAVVGAHQGVRMSLSVDT